MTWTDVRQQTYISSRDSAKRTHPHQTCPGDAIHEQIFTTEEGLPQPLRLGLLVDIHGGGQERILAHVPNRVPVEMQRRDVAQHDRRQRQRTRTRVHRLEHGSAREHLPHTELGLALKPYGPGHLDHGTRSRLDGAAVGEGDAEDRIGIPVRDLVAAPAEGPAVGAVPGPGPVGGLTLLALLALLVVALGLAYEVGVVNLRII